MKKRMQSSSRTTTLQVKRCREATWREESKDEEIPWAGLNAPVADWNYFPGEVCKKQFVKEPTYKTHKNKMQ